MFDLEDTFYTDGRDYSDKFEFTPEHAKLADWPGDGGGDGVWYGNGEGGGYGDGYEDRRSPAFNCWYV